MPALRTYSFLDVVAAISGPGGAGIQLGSGAGAAKEGITIEMLEDKDIMTVGADGQIMHSLRASNAARVSVRLLKTSPVNAQLSQLYNFQKTSSAVWGQNALVIRDVSRGDVISSVECAFARQPNNTYAEDAGMLEWTFYGNVDQLLGTGSPAAA